MQNILFICSKNQWRSPTAQKIYSKDPRVSVSSAGTSRSARHQVNTKDLIKADIIFVMEYKHKERLKSEYNKILKYKKLIVLDIPDDYQYMDGKLIGILKQSVDGYLENI